MSWIYEGAQAKQPERGIRFPNTTVAYRTAAPRGLGAASRCGPCIAASLASGLQQPSQPSQLASSQAFGPYQQIARCTAPQHLVGCDVLGIATPSALSSLRMRRGSPNL